VKTPSCISSLILVLALAGAGGCLPSKDPYVYNFNTLVGHFPSEFPHVYNVHTVVPGTLIRGGQPSERGIRALRDDLGIRTIVNLNHKTCESEAKLAARMGLAYLPLHDNAFTEAGDRERYLAFLKTVRAQGRNAPIYVHCRTGSDRVGMAVAIYRIVECGWDASRALAELRRYQPHYMAIFFHRYPAILRDVECHRANWLRELDEMPDPPIQRPARTDEMHHPNVSHGET
jgi:tyrosine-protein phosphatase SIW14